MKKKILFIGLSFYNYPAEIIKTLESKGYEVSFHAILPFTLPVRIFRHLSKRIYDRLIDKYHQKIIEDEQGKDYDYVFFLTVHFFSHHNINKLKQSQSKAKYLLYNWDPVTVFDYRSYIKYFDEVFTFDIEDSKQLDVNYLPLFATSDFFKVSSQDNYNYDVYIVGSLVTNRRYEYVQTFAEYCEANNITFKRYLKCTPLSYLNILKTGVIPKGVSFKSLGRKDFFEIVKNSKAVFDFSNHVQSGYTMRVAENLCAGKKIITNNYNIKEEEFYDTDTIFVYEGANFKGVDEFLKKEIVRKNHFTKWSIQNWVDAIFIK